MLNIEKNKLKDENLMKILQVLDSNDLNYIRTLLLFFILVTFCSMNLAISSFTKKLPNFHCSLSKSIKDSIFKNCNLTSKDLPKCQRYKDEDLVNISCQFSNLSYINSTSCTSWQFEDFQDQSIVVRYQLVCHNQSKSDFESLILLLGVFVGAFVAGAAADRFGRYRVFCVMILMVMTSSLLASVASTFNLYCVCRFFVGFGVIGSCETAVLYVVEVTRVTWRVFIGQIMQCTFSGGFMLLPLIAYFERRVFQLTLVLVVPMLVLWVFYIYFCGESPRWLLSRKGQSSAMKSLERIADVNGKQLDKLLQDEVIIGKQTALSDNDVISDGKLLDIFRNKILLMTSLILAYNWLTATCVYYGLTLGAAKLSGDIYINFFLNGLIEIPANFGSIFLLNQIGRRFTVFLANMIGGFSLLAMFFVTTNDVTARLVLFLLGKFGSTASFSCLYLYTTELYPTLLR